MIDERYHSSLSNARAYSGYDANSDHDPAIENIKIHLRALKRPKRKPRFLLKTDTPKNSQISADFLRLFLKIFQRIKLKKILKINGHLKNLKTSIITAANKLITQEFKKINQPH